MVQAISIHETAAGHSNGTSVTRDTAAMESSHSMPYLSTEPAPNASFNKVIAITGANRGIGLGLAEVFLANNAAVVYSLDVLEPGEEFAALAKKNPNRFKFLHMDVTDEPSIQKTVDQIVEAEGAIHGMVANAGMTKHQPALDFTREQVEQLYRLNVFGAFSCAQAAARKFIQLGVKGSIVFTASMTSYRPNRAGPSAPYGGTKAALRNMTHTLAMEWAEHGIRVNSVSPGKCRTLRSTHQDKFADNRCRVRTDSDDCENRVSTGL
jgi:NAD(P)-dependent dehydrogenase (short-subunit alcohol dehydrogenase family)